MKKKNYSERPVLNKNNINIFLITFKRALKIYKYTYHPKNTSTKIQLYTIINKKTTLKYINTHSHIFNLYFLNSSC